MDQRKTENLKIPLPMPNGDNNQDYFTDAFSTIDRNAANEEDLKKLREEVESSLQAKNVKISDKELNFQSGDVEGALIELANENKKQSQILVDGLKAENINTTHSYHGSSKNIESALSSISKEVDRHKYANGIRIRDARNNFQSTEVEGALTELATKQNAHSQRTDNPHRVTKAQVGLSNVDDIKQATKSEFDTHKNNKNNPHNVTKSQVGLGNVDNIKQATKTEHNALKSRVDNLHAKDIKVTSSTNLKSTSVDKALDELFTYADDAHSRWASSIGAPLNKEDTAETKEKKTKELIKELDKKVRDEGYYPVNRTLKDVLDSLFYTKKKTARLSVNPSKGGGSTAYIQWHIPKNAKVVEEKISGRSYTLKFSGVAEGRRLTDIDPNLNTEEGYWSTFFELKDYDYSASSFIEVLNGHDSITDTDLKFLYLLLGTSYRDFANIAVANTYEKELLNVDLLTNAIEKLGDHYYKSGILICPDNIPSYRYKLPYNYVLADSKNKILGDDQDVKLSVSELKSNESFGEWIKLARERGKYNCWKDYDKEEYIALVYNSGYYTSYPKGKILYIKMDMNTDKPISVKIV